MVTADTARVTQRRAPVPFPGAPLTASTPTSAGVAANALTRWLARRSLISAGEMTATAFTA